MKIAVFCSSSNRIPQVYKAMAFQLGCDLAQRGHTLVYGGATGGLMDAIAEGFASEKGEIIGVIPEVIIRSGRISSLPTQLIKTNSMSERKQLMREEADLFVVLPGSYGTLDEMFDVLASGTVGEHKKPLVCINVEDFFASLMLQIKNMAEQAFIPEQEHYKPQFVDSADDFLTWLDEFKSKNRSRLMS